MPLRSIDSLHIAITGASRGIGRALAVECASRGARLTVCARSEAPLQDVVATLGATGGVLDVRNALAVEAWLRSGVVRAGPIDVLVNNAALLGPKETLTDYPLEDWREVMDVNVNGAFVVTRAALPHMRRPGGIVLHMTSYLGLVALPRFGAYCASKFAVEGLARLVAEEHREDGLISCAVDPGMVQTDMLRAAAETDDVAEYPTAAEAAVAFANLIESLEAADSGQTRPLFPA